VAIYFVAKRHVWTITVALLLESACWRQEKKVNLTPFAFPDPLRVSTFAAFALVEADEIEAIENGEFKRGKYKINH
jgi:hypothetical protein